jgi:integrase
MKAVSPVSVNIELRTLRAALYTALRWGLMAENPFKKVPLVHIPEQQPTYLSKEEFQTLLSVVREPWLREIFLIAVCTGLRRGELLNLTWKDVDFQRRLLNIQSGENFKTKAGKRRSVPMSQVVCQLLLARAQRSFDGFVFTVNGRRVVEYFVSHRFKACVRAAGLNEKLHFHSLRHTFATWLVQNGVNIYEVQKLLGHSNISVTQIYSHLVASELHRAVEKISVAVN